MVGRSRNIYGRRLWWLLAATILWAGSVQPPQAQAQEEAPVMTLEQSILIALERNLDVQVAREEIAAAREQKHEATTGFLPKMKAEYSYTRPSETTINFMGNTIRTQDKNQYRFTGGVEQPIFTGFSILSNYQLAKLGLDVAEIQLERSRLDIILQVKEAYFGILSAQKIQEVAEQAVQQLQAQLEVAENFYQVGMSPKIDVLDAEVRLAEAQQELIRAANDVRLAKARFNTILRQPVDQDVKVIDILSEKPYEKSYAACVQLSLEQRPELVEAEKNVARAEKQITLAKSDYYPSVALTADLVRQGDDLTVSGSTYSDREKWNVAAVATWTFFEWGKTRYAVNRQRARLRQAKKTREQLEDAVRLETKTAYLNLEAAEANVRVAKKSVESAEENFRISKERYREQVATATEVLDAQTRLTQARTNYTNALVDFNVAQARLIRAMGLEG
ncbi:MAG: TolC family protein [Syntrophobacteria bacterium]